MSKRPIAWAIAAVAVLVIALFVVPMFVPWTAINCRHQDVDILSGRLRYTRFLLFCKVSERTEDSPLTKILPADMIATPSPEWHRVNTFSPGVRNSPHYAFHGAIQQMKDLAQIWDLAGDYGFSEELKRKTAADVLAVWQQSGDDSLAGDYIRCLYDVMDEGKRQGILTALANVRMPLVETNGTDVVHTVFFPNGRPMDRIHGYVDKSGKFVRHGVWEYWGADGTRLLYGHFENGEHHGLRFEWDLDGKLSRISAFNHNQLCDCEHENLEKHPDFRIAQQPGARDGVSAARDP